MKKLLVTFITGLIVACFCLLLPVIVDLGPSETPLGNLSNTSGANVVTPFTTEGESLKDVTLDNVAYKLSIGATSSGSDPVVIGPDRAKILQDGESVVMEYTIVSGDVNITTSGQDYGFLISEHSNIASCGPTGASGAFGWYCRGGSGYVTGEGAGTITSGYAGYGPTFYETAGCKVRAIFTPAQSETELGTFEVYYKKSGETSYTLSLQVVDIPEICGRTKTIWMIFNGDAEIVIKDYSITTTHGANLLSVSGKTNSEVNVNNEQNRGTYVYDCVGMAYVNNKCTYSISAQTASQAFTFGAQSVVFPKTAANLSDGSSAVLEFDVDAATIAATASSDQFGITLESVYAATNAGSYASAGVYFYSRREWGEFAGTGASKFWNTSSGSTTGRNGYTATGLMKAGNSVKIVYKPYVSETEKGTLDVYQKATGATEYTRVAWAEGILDGLKSNVSICLRTNTTATSFTLSNYKFYTVNSNGVKTIVHSALGGELQKVATGTAGTITETINTVNTINVPEYSLTFGGLYFGRGVTDYVAYVKQGGSYTLPVKPYGIDGHFIHWSTSMGIKQGGAVVTPTGNINVTPVGIHFNMNSTAVNTYGAYGLQFGTLIDYDEYVALNSHNDENDITTGTIIVPASYVGTVALTLDALETSGKTYLNIVNDGFANAASVSSGGDYEFYGAIVNILDKNLARDFVAVGYMSFEVGEYSYTLYTEVSEETSIYEVAKSAYATAEGEVKTKIAELYLDRVVEITDGAIVTADGYTSPYTIEGGKLVGENVDEIAIVIVDGTKKLAADSGYIA